MNTPRLTCYGFLTVLLFAFFSGDVNAQNQKDRPLIQFSGVVVSSDSIQPIPFANVIIRQSRRGTMTDLYGFFSFVAMKGDTIDFQYIGYKHASFVIPDTLNENRYSMIQVLIRDTVQLKEMVIYPWPSREDFKQAFLELRLPDDDMKRAMRNIQMAQMSEIADQVPYDGSINFKFTNQQRQTQLYTAGQFPSISLLNPLAWAAFIQSWKDGAFKKKENR